MAKIFVSYSHIDGKIADDVVGVLDDVGVEYFRDIKNIDWGKAITSSVRDGLMHSSAILVILSPASLKSQWVPYEIGHASALRKVILPYLTHPSLDPPQYMRDFNCVTTLEQIRDYFTHKFVVELADTESLVRYISGASTYALLELECQGGALHYDRIAQATSRLYESADGLRNGSAKVLSSLLLALGLASDLGNGTIAITDLGREVAHSKPLAIKNKSAVQKFNEDHGIK